MSEYVVPVDVAETAIMLGVLFGIVFGILFMVFLLYMQRYVNRRDFKRYFHELPDTEQLDLIESVEVVNEKLEYLARRSNTKFFIIFYNQILKFESYIKEKWRPN